MFVAWKPKKSNIFTNNIVTNKVRTSKGTHSRKVCSKCQSWVESKHEKKIMVLYKTNKFNEQKYGVNIINANATVFLFFWKTK